jgi:peptide-methionine (S)-S-oxide reductase
MALETITLGGGRFWDLEAVFQQIRGVKSTQCGYAGGLSECPTYETVCGGETGHAEVLRLAFDNDILSYRHVLEVFFKIHNPLNAAIIDGRLASPHRSVIFFHSLEQKNQALDTMKAMGLFSNTKVLTDVKPCPSFYPAEVEHQNFYKNHANDSYSKEFIVPKILMSREVFKKRLAA